MTKRVSKQEAPRRGRDGFYKLGDGQKLLSVTNIKKYGVATDLTGWAGWEAGMCAVESIPKLARIRGAAERRKVAYWLGQASVRKRNAAGELGSAVHDLIESEILGKPAAAPSADERPFMDAFHRFMDIESPTFEATEMVLAHPDDGWAGTADAFLTLPNIGGSALLLGDWKTGSGTYPDFALQLAAYRRATVGWLKDGTEVVPPKTEDAVVIHIRPDKYPDTGYRIVPYDTSDAVYECFLSARKTAVEWAKGLEKTAMGQPYEPVLVAEIEEEPPAEEVA